MMRSTVLVATLLASTILSAKEYPVSVLEGGGEIIRSATGEQVIVSEKEHRKQL